MATPTTPAGSRLVHVSPIEDALIRKMALVTSLVLADPRDVPPAILEAARDAYALYGEMRS